MIHLIELDHWCRHAWQLYAAQEGKDGEHFVRLYSAPTSPPTFRVVQHDEERICTTAAVDAFTVFNGLARP